MGSNTFVGMSGISLSNTNVGTGVNLQNADRGNPNGDVVDNSAGDNAAADGHENSLGNERGAYRRRYSSPSALYPNS